MDFTLYALLKAYVNQTIENSQSGIKGESAYEIAVRNGFVGTEQEWLKSLKGETPYIGDNGHWFVGTLDTGVVATPDLSAYYSKENLIPLTTQEILEICQ